jgi:hypothetical protein
LSAVRERTLTMIQKQFKRELNTRIQYRNKSNDNIVSIPSSRQWLEMEW